MKPNPKLSIIVPVFNVEEFLRQCLESILRQDFDDFELIAIDDCSPDGSARILREFQQRDSRVRIISLDQNAGLGAARNRGLAAATGDYIWFLDSDDELCPNTLSLLIERADQTRADVVLFGWVRFYEDGTEKGGGRSDLLAVAPRTFTAAQWPRVMKVIQVAWNKLIRRELLERTQLQFPDGYYEDTAFTYPLLAAAGSISTLPRTVVRYRQRTGAITATRSERHFEVFDQWRRAMIGLEGLDANGTLRAALFPLMIRHCTYILMGGRRIPPDRRHEYLRCLKHLHDSYRHLSSGITRTAFETIELAMARLGSLHLLTLFWGLRSVWWKIRRARLRHAFRPSSADPYRVEKPVRTNTAA